MRYINKAVKSFFPLNLIFHEWRNSWKTALLFKRKLIQAHLFGRKSFFFFHIIYIFLVKTNFKVTANLLTFILIVGFSALKCQIMFRNISPHKIVKEEVIRGYFEGNFMLGIRVPTINSDHFVIWNFFFQKNIDHSIILVKMIRWLRSFYSHHNKSIFIWPSSTFIFLFQLEEKLVFLSKFYSQGIFQIFLILSFAEREKKSLWNLSDQVKNLTEKVLTELLG